MTRRTYPAIVEAATDGYGVGFPDLPGCVSHGLDYETALRSAEEALSLHLEGMTEDGDVFPEPLRLSDIAHDYPIRADYGPNAAWALVTVEAPDAAERVNVYLPKSLLERVDRRAAAAGLNRSSFFANAAREYMAKPSNPPGPAVSRAPPSIKPIS